MQKVRISEKVTQEMDRLRQQPYILTQSNLYEMEADLEIVYVNAQSLYGHNLDVTHDFNLVSVDIFTCVETRFHKNDKILFARSMPKVTELSDLQYTTPCNSSSEFDQCIILSTEEPFCSIWKIHNHGRFPPKHHGK